MTGNKRDKNNTKKSWKKRNSGKFICDCFLCKGNWYRYFLEKTRSRNKYIKYTRDNETKKT